MKNRHIALFLSLSLPVLLTSCKWSDMNPDNIHPEGPPFNDQNELVTTVNNYLASQQKRYNCFASGQSFTVTDYLTMEGTCPNGIVQSTDEGQRNAKNVRDETIERALFVIDANYVEWVNYLYLGRATGNFVADTVQLTTSGVIGALNGPAETLRVLGIALNTFQGARSSFDLNYFDKQNTTVIVNQMDSNRSKAYAVILAKKDKDIAKYPLAEAIKDLVAYYNAGTLVSAFTALSQQTAINSQASADAVRVLQGIPISIPITTESTLDIAERAVDILNKLKSSIDNPNEKILATDQLNKIISSLKTDKDFQSIMTENALAYDPLILNPKQQVDFLRSIRKQARPIPKYADLLIRIDRTIINLSN